MQIPAIYNNNKPSPADVARLHDEAAAVERRERELRDQAEREAAQRRTADMRSDWEQTKTRTTSDMRNGILSCVIAVREFYRQADRCRDAITGDANHLELHAIRNLYTSGLVDPRELKLVAEMIARSFEV